MGQQAAHRLARRETKRTLGQHLAKYAENQDARLAVLEAELKAVNARLIQAEVALEDHTGKQSTTTQRELVTLRVGFYQFTSAGFVARFRWFWGF